MLRRPGVLSSIIVLFVAGVMTIWTAIRYQSRRGEDIAHVEPQHELYEVAWDQLPEIKPFQLTERSGETFDSEQMDGQVWVVSYFFSRCPSVCKRQNETIQRLRFKLKDRPVTFVSITCDPEYDTPEVLTEYAKKYQADAEGWKFLTGTMNDVVRVGNESFQIAVGPETHSTSLMVIDKWGRYRDRIDWELASELNRFAKVLDECLSESEPPADLQVTTRVPIAGQDASHAASDQPRRLVTTAEEVAQLVGNDWKERDWNDRFSLVERNGEVVTSESLQGKVWVANFFFTRCPVICKKLMTRLQALHPALAQQGVPVVSITTDTAYDTPDKLAAYAASLGLAMNDRSWLFLVGEALQTRRVASEFFKAFADGEDHDTRLIVIDKWGQVRGGFQYDDDQAIVALRALVTELLAETEPLATDTPAPAVDPDEALLEELMEGLDDKGVSPQGTEADKANTDEN